MKHKNSLIRLFIGLVYLSGFVIYYLGYDLETTVMKLDVSIIQEATRIFFAVFSSAAMFTLNNGLSDIRADLTNNPFYLVIFWSVHSMAIFATFATFFLIFQYKIMNYLRIKSATNKRRYFIWGADEEVLVLINNIRIQEVLPHEITILLNDKTGVFIEQLEGLKVSYAHIYPDLHKFVARLGIKRNLKQDNYLILMQSDHDENIRVAIELLKLPLIKMNDKIHIIVNCDQDEWMENILDDAVVNMKTYHMADLVARHFIQNYPPYNHVALDINKANISSDYHVVIIGFGDLGEQILLKMISQGQFYGKVFKATVIEQSHNQNIGKFKRLYSSLIEKYNICFHHIAYDSDEFNRMLGDSADSISAIVVCTDDDHINKNVGIELNQYLKKIVVRINPLKIFIKNSMPSSFIKKLHEDVDTFKNVYFFGALDEVLSPDIIINEKLDLLAESIHNYYTGKSYGTMVEWKQLSPFLKDSNRNAALHIFTKLGLVGLKTKPIACINKEDKIIESKGTFIKHIGSHRLEQLGKHEHARWCAFHHIYGWEQQPVVYGHPIKDKYLKTHGCLVPWDVLEEISTITGEDYQASCLDQIENCYEYLKNIRYVIYEEACS